MVCSVPSSAIAADAARHAANQAVVAIPRKPTPMGDKSRGTSQHALDHALAMPNRLSGQRPVSGTPYGEANHNASPEVKQYEKDSP